MRSASASSFFDDDSDEEAVSDFRHLVSRMQQRWPFDSRISDHNMEPSRPWHSPASDVTSGAMYPFTNGIAEAGERRPITAMVVMTGANGPTITLMFAGAGAGNNLAGLAEMLTNGEGDGILRQVLSLAAPPTPKRHLCLEAIATEFPAQDWSGAGGDVCTVCMGDLQDGEQYRTLGCSHRFHVECIDHWLTGKSTGDSCDTNMCPNCRAPVEVEELATESTGTMQHSS